MRLFLGLFVISSLSFAVQASVTTSKGHTQINFCSDQFVSSASAYGFGPHENCRRAQRMAESSAIFSCLEAGHDRCSAIAAKQVEFSYDRCSFEAFARPRPGSMCSPQDTFVGKAWAQNYGSEQANCHRAFRVAEENAMYSCYYSGANNCRVLYRHVIQTRGPSYCEVGVIVKNW